MVGALMITATICTTQLYPRIGPKILVSAGMLIGAGGMAWLTGIGPQLATYAADILGPLLVIGIGMGAIIAPAMNAATTGVQARDAGVASARSTPPSRSAARSARRCSTPWPPPRWPDYLVGKNAGSQIVKANAAIHSYTVAFWSASRDLRGRRGHLRPDPARPTGLEHGFVISSSAS